MGDVLVLGDAMGRRLALESVTIEREPCRSAPATVAMKVPLTAAQRRARLESQIDELLAKARELDRIAAARAKRERRRVRNMRNGG